MAAEPAASRRLTAAEYLARERAAETKSEYYAGEVFAMTGASRISGSAECRALTSRTT